MQKRVRIKIELSEKVAQRNKKEYTLEKGIMKSFGLRKLSQGESKKVIKLDIV